MTPQTEILVHISGPSRGADDARYRREALGYLQFEIAERHSLLGLATHAPNAEKRTHAQVETVDAEDDQAQGVLVASEAETSSPAEKAADKSKVIDRPDRLPPLRTPTLFTSPASTLPRTATKQTPHILIERTPALPRPRTAPTAPTLPHAPPLRRSQSDSWHTPPSVIPDSQPSPPSSGLPEISSPPYRKRPYHSSSPSPTHRASPPAKRPRLRVCSSPPLDDPPVEARLPATAPASSPPSKRSPSPEVPSSPPPQTPAALAPSSSPTPANPPTTSPPTANNPPQSLEIHPPRPKTTTDAFSTHITKSLSKLAAILPLEKHFKPITYTRTPTTLERGHWLVPIHAWDETSKRKFWDYLYEFVGQNGQAGWGTWCAREVQELGPAGGGEGSEKENTAPRPGEVVKVYCWGEVVGEIWLVLFIGSGRKIKGSGARWIDAGGEAVVVMR